MAVAAAQPLSEPVSEPTHRRAQLACLWCGPASLALVVVGFWFIAGFVPPQSAGRSAAQIAAFYRENADQIRIGMIVAQIGAALTGPFVIAIFLQMKRVEGRWAPWAYSQLILGAFNVLLYIFPFMVWVAASFRADRDPAIVQTLNDLGWLPFLGIWAITSLQYVVMALCAFSDKDQTVFPRWFGYFNLYVALGLAPVVCMYFFKTGAFSWRGVVSFWEPFLAFLAWYVVTFVVVRRAILTHR